MANEEIKVVEQTPGVVEDQVYELHCKVPREMLGYLKDAAKLAYKMGVITKTDLVDLMNLFIGWGMSVLKAKWTDRMGYPAHVGSFRRMIRIY